LSILEFNGKKPRIHPSCYVACSATIVGDVTIGEDSNIWPNAVVRGDLNSVKIDTGVSIQDCCVIHVDPTHPVTFGDRVLMGHCAVAHGCRVGNNVLIGIRAIVLNDVTIGDWVIVAAGSLVTEGTDIPSHSIVMGAPAKVVKTLEERHLKMIVEGTEGYVRLGQAYRHMAGTAAT
jgi:carbonic anhydrase/acetyltransferase-like protein (isoleucine patch superfamily)